MRRLIFLSLLLVFISFGTKSAFAQGGQTLFGDVRISTEDNTLVPEEVTLILRRAPDGEVGRQTISSRGRYRFTNLIPGDYEIVVEANGKEIGRIQQITIRNLLSNSPQGNQYDLDFRWQPEAAHVGGVISAADVYDRPAATRATFQKAEDAVGKKKYDQAVDLLKQVIDTDKNDFQAWTALGTVYFAEQKLDDSEKAYRQAIEIQSDELRHQEVTGVFQANDPASFISFLARTPGIKIETSPDGARVVVSQGQ